MDLGEVEDDAAPTVAKQRRIHGSDPRLPAGFARFGARYFVRTRICVSADGGVSSVDVLESADAAVDAAVVASVRGWRYQPFGINGRPVPFCYLSNFDFEVR